MGQLITVSRKPSIRPDVAIFELNRSLTGMGHERYKAAADAVRARPVDELARRLFEAGGVEGVHIYSNMVTVDLAAGRHGRRHGADHPRPVHLLPPGRGGRRAHGVVVQSCTSLYNLEMSTVTVSEARASLPELLDRVLEGEEVTITRHGQPVAVVVRPDVLQARRAAGAFAAAQALHELLDQARRTPLAVQGTLTPEHAEDLIAEVQAGRSRREPWTRSTPTS